MSGKQISGFVKECCLVDGKCVLLECYFLVFNVYDS